MPYSRRTRGFDFPICQATLYTESSDSFVASAAASIATGWSEPVPGREFHPLKSSAFHGALLRQRSGFRRSKQIAVHRSRRQRTGAPQNRNEGCHDYDCWDVHTNKDRYWVITCPTNLYPQKYFPSLDFTLSFHIGVSARIVAMQRGARTCTASKAASLRPRKPALHLQGRTGTGEDNPLTTRHCFTRYTGLTSTFTDFSGNGFTHLRLLRRDPFEPPWL
jgi:hypothetical protein